MDEPRVSFFLPSLAGGGAERVVLNAARGLAAVGHDVEVVVATSPDEVATVPFDDVAVIELGASRMAGAVWPLLKHLRARRPDVVISALYHANMVAVIAANAARIPIAVTVHSHQTSLFEDIEARGDRSRWLTPVIRRAIRLAYARADRVVAVSEGVRESLEVGGIADVQVLPNPVVSAELRTAATKIPEHRFLVPGSPAVVVAVGRLVPQKNFEMFLDVIAKVAKRRDIRAIILGEGPQRANLETQAEALGIADIVDLPGWVDNPYVFLAAADLFALTSRFEGLPTVLIEALACGTPVVSTDCPSGPADILERGRWGRLVPVGDSDAFAKAVIDSLESAPVPPAESWRRFDEASAVEGYRCLVEELAGG